MENNIEKEIDSMFEDTPETQTYNVQASIYTKEILEKVQKSVKEAAAISHKLASSGFEIRRGLKNTEMIGILLLDGKGSLPHDSRSLLDKVISPNTVQYLNYVHGTGAEEFARILKSTLSNGADTGKNAHFYEQAHSVVYWGMVLHIALVDFCNESKSPAAYFKTFRSVADPFKVVDGKPYHPIFSKLGILEEFEIPGHPLKSAKDFYEKFSAKTGEEKDSILSTMNGWLGQFEKDGNKLANWTACEESQINIEDVLYGARYGMALPDTLYGPAGLAIQALMKARLYSAVKKREQKGLTRLECGQSKVVILIDECHSAMGADDKDITPIGRSMDIISIYATQTIEGLLARFSENETKQFLETFGSVISFKSSKSTLGWLRERIGMASLLRRQNATQTLDFQNSSKLQMGSPYFNLNHPLRSAMKKLTMGSWFKRWFTFNSLRLQPGVSLNETNLSGISTMTLSDKEEYIMTEKDMAKLQTQFYAAALINRGEGPRRDIVKMKVLDADFNEIDTSNSRVAEILKKALKKIAG